MIIVNQEKKATVRGKIEDRKRNEKVVSEEQRKRVTKKERKKKKRRKKKKKKKEKEGQGKARAQDIEWRK